LKEAQLKNADQRKQREILEAERQEAIKTRTKLELQIQDLSSRAEREKTERRQIEEQIRELREQIQNVRFFTFNY
jgi:predicted  nucleic acid-binding Zn-ribbon protein